MPLWLAELYLDKAIEDFMNLISVSKTYPGFQGMP
jgi:hypothetical protein